MIASRSEVTLSTTTASAVVVTNAPPNPVSYAPMSVFGPCARGTRRWSVAGPRPVLPASIAGLVGPDNCKACVGEKPPLSASESSSGSVAIRSPPEKPVEPVASCTMLLPSDVIVPETSGSAFGAIAVSVLLEKIVLAVVTKPPPAMLIATPPPALARLNAMVLLISVTTPDAPTSIPPPPPPFAVLPEIVAFVTDAVPAIVIAPPRRVAAFASNVEPSTVTFELPLCTNRPAPPRAVFPVKRDAETTAWPPSTKIAPPSPEPVVLLFEKVVAVNDALADVSTNTAPPTTPELVSKTVFATVSTPSTRTAPAAPFALFPVNILLRTVAVPVDSTASPPPAACVSLISIWTSSSSRNENVCTAPPLPTALPWSRRSSSSTRCAPASIRNTRLELPRPSINVVGPTPEISMAEIEFVMLRSPVSSPSPPLAAIVKVYVPAGTIISTFSAVDALASMIAARSVVCRPRVTRSESAIPSPTLASTASFSELTVNVTLDSSVRSSTTSTRWANRRPRAGRSLGGPDSRSHCTRACRSSE